MSIALVTTRRDYQADYQEERDSLDIKLVEFFNLLDIYSILLPNNYSNLELIIGKLDFEIVILTGGGSIEETNTESSDRIKIEQLLIKAAIEQNKKIIGICRGMQAILKYFNIGVSHIPNHVNFNHNLIDKQGKIVAQVNSYHNLGIRELSENEFEILFRAQDNSIEAIKHKKLAILGMMWHPERNKNFAEFDINLIKEFLK